MRSGSFLLGVYDLLLKYHGNYYHDNRTKARKGDCIERDGRLYLSLRTKRQILLNNIYGVDIDAQAVEVCQLSLYLKLLQDETEASARQTQMDFFHEAKMKKLLPDLSMNILCGNSLVGRDILTAQLFPRDEELKLNSMNFEDAFPEVMKRGGFDALVGNPPYVRIQTMRESSPASVNYLARHYRSAAKGNYDIYVAFIEAGLTRLNNGGKLGFIVPHKCFNAKYGKALRSVIADGQHLAHVVPFGDQQVFEGATTYTCLLFLDKSAAPECRILRVGDLNKWRVHMTHNAVSTTQGAIPAEKITGAQWNFVVGKGATLFERLASMPAKLRDVATGVLLAFRQARIPFFYSRSSKRAEKVQLPLSLLNLARRS